MWILPKNYPLSSRFAQDMVASKEDLTLPDLNIESSLMWRSKPSRLRTWCRRWRPESYLPHLFTRILKPSHRKSFETALTSSLLAIHVNRFQQQEIAKEKMTQGTCGLTYGDTSKQLDLLNASLKTSKDTYRLDYPQSSATWKRMVLAQRGEYSARKNSASVTKGSASLSVPTPIASDACGGRITTEYRAGFKSLRKSSNQWFGAKLRDALEMNRPLDLVQNPCWTEELMGVPIGWTELNF